MHSLSSTTLALNQMYHNSHSMVQGKGLWDATTPHIRIRNPRFTRMIAPSSIYEGLGPNIYISIHIYIFYLCLFLSSI